MSAFTDVGSAAGKQGKTSHLKSVLAAFSLALMLLLGASVVNAGSANAAFIANPGAFDSSFAGGYLKLTTFDPFEVGEGGELGDITLNGGVMNANGTYTVPKANVVFPDLELEPIDVSGIGTINPVVKIAANSDVTGVIDPLTGEMTMNFDLTINVRGTGTVSFGQNGQCFIGSPSNPIQVRASTTAEGGIGYNPGTGRGRVADNTFIVPKATGCGTVLLVVNVNDQLNTQLGLNDQVPGSNVAQLELETHPAFITNAELNITTKPAAATNQKNANFVFTSNVPSGMNYECRLDAGAWTPCDSKTASYTGLADGSHTFAARAVLGSTVLGSTSYTWSIDTVIPVYTVSGAPTGLVNTRNANLTFTVNKSMPAGATRCSLDGATPVACSSPQNLTGLADGSHTFTVSGTDAVGNFGTTSRSWTVDATKPVASINSGPVGVSSTSDVEFTFTATDNMTANPVTQCQVRNRKDNSIVQAWTACASPYQQVRPTGKWQLQLRATDNAGNVSDVQNYDWDANTAEPVIVPERYTFNGGQTQESSGGTRSSDAEFEFDAATYELDENDEPVEIAGTEFTYECWLDGVSLGACESPMTLHDLNGGTPLAEGHHIFEVKPTTVAAPPVAGNRTAFEWYVDTVDPTAAIVDGPPVHQNSSFATFALEINGTGSQGTAQCKLDNGPWDNCDSDTAHEVGVADGEHTLRVRAVDQAGNQSSVVSRTWQADTEVPQVELNEWPVENAASSTAEFVFQTNDNDANVEALCQLDENQEVPCDSRTSHTLEGVSDGVHTFTVTGKDRAGNTTSDDYTWRVDTTAPALEITAGPSELTNQSSAAFKFLSTDGGSGIDTITCRIDNGSLVTGSDCSNGNVWNFYPGPFASGNHTYVVRVTDRAGNETVKSRAWKVDNTPADVAIATRIGETKSTSAAIEFFSSEESATFECKLDAQTFQACESPIVLSDLGLGSHVFSVRSVDAAGNRSVEDSISWTVLAPDPETCPEGQVGTPPNCEEEVCPDGQIGTPPNCETPQDPKCEDEGKVGTWPNCETPQDPKCEDEGKIGTWPNCKSFLPPIEPNANVTSYDVATGKLQVRLKCPAGLKPRCQGTAVAVTGKGKNAKAMSNAVKSNSKAGKWKLVTLTIKPAYREKVALMATVDSKQLTIRQVVKSAKVKKKRTVFHTYKVRAKA